ncbi:hypothetical protein AQUSIP_07600 [Aquicella siphonis]|uniref:Uncharacterized protein n=1 Tax=Aquicella siphonis TaxID=254247 RepID=A0A5E4PER5_9COXI|nr:hypothetical protein [Aquicella siphonis]VVC75470.1 hypothetical protein AQUSIP_07600 [Aquicella siphonis]
MESRKKANNINIKSSTVTIISAIANSENSISVEVRKKGGSLQFTGNDQSCVVNYQSNKPAVKTAFRPDEYDTRVVKESKSKRPSLSSALETMNEMDPWADWSFAESESEEPDQINPSSNVGKLI